MKDTLIIYSGGMDSTVLLNDYSQQIALAVSFDYGSKHNKKEIAYAHWNCKQLGIKHKIIDLSTAMADFNSSLIQKDLDVPEGHYEDKSMKSTVVPFRNGIMLSIAVGLAESYGLKKVYLASHAGDHAVYPDCRSEFTTAISLAAQLGTYEGVQILSPYNSITKRDIALHGKGLGVDFAETWSCYKGKEKHCGKCGTCVERIEALEGFDTTEYEDGI